MQRLEVSGAVRLIYLSLDVKGLKSYIKMMGILHEETHEAVSASGP